MPRKSIRHVSKPCNTTLSALLAPSLSSAFSRPFVGVAGSDIHRSANQKKKVSQHHSKVDCWLPTNRETHKTNKLWNLPPVPRKHGKVAALPANRKLLRSEALDVVPTLFFSSSLCSMLLDVVQLWYELSQSVSVQLPSHVGMSVFRLISSSADTLFDDGYKTCPYQHGAPLSSLNWR